MGAGFIIGGFCPGTSVCAAAIGKIDALVFIFGIFVGIFLFAEGYPMLEKFFISHHLGSPRIPELVGMSSGVFVFLVICAAAAMFWIGEWAERSFPRDEY